MKHRIKYQIKKAMHRPSGGSPPGRPGLGGKHLGANPNLHRCPHVTSPADRVVHGEPTASGCQTMKAQYEWRMAS